MKATAAATASAMALCSCGTSSAFTTHTSFSRVSAPRNAVGKASAKGTLRPRTLNMAVAIPPAVSVETAPPVTIDMEGVQLSGLNGLALQPKTFPTKREVMDVIPKHCFVKDTVRSMKYAVLSCAITLSMGGLAATFLPLKVRQLTCVRAFEKLVC